MAGFKMSCGLLGSAVSCLVALSLIVVASCAPLCAGSVCLPQKSTSSTEAGCHGMGGHHGTSSFLAARTAVCQLGDAGLAIVAKSGLSVNSDAPATDFHAAPNFLQSFVGSSTEVWVSSGPPGTIFSTPTSLVLRV
ncbi:MAG: hypothetical protein JSS69_04230 [Acidobacteria bacterium]|nr:hypothetical protein [Acidobacteriota bacterium]